MNLELNGRVVSVTGGASNVGLAISEGFAREGAKTVILDFDAAQTEKTVNRIREAGGDVHGAILDVTDESAVRETITRIETEIGPIAILVNNVGWAPRNEFFLETGPERWDKAFRMNLASTFTMTHAVLPHMVERRMGSIVNITSDAAAGVICLSDYGAMKAGVIAFSRALAEEYGRYAIRVNAVAPGTIVPDADDIGEKSFWAGDGLSFSDKAMQRIAQTTALRKLPVASDVADTVLFIASERARALTGQYVSVSSGFVMPR